MNLQYMPVMHVMIRSLIINSHFDLNDVPNKMFKFAAREYDDYLRESLKENENFHKTREFQLVSKIFEKINELGYYRKPDLFEGVTDAN